MENSRIGISRRDFLRWSAAAAGSVLWSRAANSDWTKSLPVDAQVRALAEAAPLALQFRGQTDAEARAWQATFKRQLEALLGSYRPPARWESVFERTVDVGDHVREERLLTATGHAAVPVVVLRPKRKPTNGKYAGIVAIHGHNMSPDSIAGRDDTPESRNAIARYRCDYGLHLVRRGYVIVAPCLTPFGRRLAESPGEPRRDACETTQLRLQLVGRNLLVENLRDCLWALECLAVETAVDPNRLGCVGLSLGGRMTTFVTALDSRIKVAVIAGALNCLQEKIIARSIGGCQTLPGLLEYGDIPEIAGLAAPRTILWTAGDRDPQVKWPEAENALERMRRVYRALGAEDQLLVHRFSGGHEWNGEVVHPLLDRVLAG